MVALYNRLPARITEYLTNTNKAEILKYFTERRLRPLTLLGSDDDKLLKFDEMMEAIIGQIEESNNHHVNASAYPQHQTAIIINIAVINIVK